MIRKTGRKGMLITAVFLVVCVLWGCAAPINTNRQEDEVTDFYADMQENKELIVVGFSQIGSESVWRTANTNSVQNSLTKEAGYFLIFDNARQKQENQIKAIRSYISQRVDYIVFSPITESGWDTVLAEAKDAGIPVILVDRMVDADESLYTTWIGPDSVKEGEKAARWLERYLRLKNRQQEEINIVVLQGTVGASSQVGRTKGFGSLSVRHPNWKILEQKSGDFTVAKGKEVMEQFLKKYSDIDVVVSQNDDMSFGAIEAIENAGMKTGENGDIILISFDAVKQALELVEAGIINVDVECNPEQGKYISDIIQRLERGEEVEKAYYVEERVFTRENVSQYIDDRTY